MSERESLVGRRVAARWDVVARLGGGGFSSVYLVRNALIPELKCALKVLELEKDALQSRARFEQEARIVASLKAPHIAAVRDYGHLDDGRPYLLAAYIEGDDLSEVVAARGRLSTEATWAVAHCVLQALIVVHRAGILHRDVKPSNLLVDLSPPNGAVAHLTDFGVAKVLDALASPVGPGVRTEGGLLIGTPGYAAPEVFLGKPDYRSDLFSLGMTMATMLRGRPVFEALSPREVFAAYASSSPLDLGAEVLESPLASIVTRAVALRADERFASAEAMHEALLAAGAGFDRGQRSS